MANDDYKYCIPDLESFTTRSTRFSLTQALLIHRMWGMDSGYSSGSRPARRRANAGYARPQSSETGTHRVTGRFCILALMDRIL